MLAATGDTHKEQYKPTPMATCAALRLTMEISSRTSMAADSARVARHASRARNLSRMLQCTTAPSPLYDGARIASTNLERLSSNLLRLPDDLYVHRSALDCLEPVLRIYVLRIYKAWQKAHPGE
jgi:hypothetical protein